jgi:hypothetical protein
LTRQGLIVSYDQSRLLDLFYYVSDGKSFAGASSPEKRLEFISLFYTFGQLGDCFGLVAFRSKAGNYPKLPHGNTTFFTCFTLKLYHTWTYKKRKPRIFVWA